MPVITPAVYTVLSSKNSCKLHKNLKLMERRERKECYHPLAQSIYGYYDHRQSMWRRNAAVWSWLCVLPVGPVVMATEYLADWFMFLNRLEISLYLKKSLFIRVLKWGMTAACALIRASVRNSYPVAFFFKARVWGSKDGDIHWIFRLAVTSNPTLPT